MAARNAHKAFLYACALLDLEVSWLWPQPGPQAALWSCPVSAHQLETALSALPRTPAAVYITSPDYLGQTADVAALAAVCHTGFGTHSPGHCRLLLFTLSAVFLPALYLGYLASYALFGVVLFVNFGLKGFQLLTRSLRSFFFGLRLLDGAYRIFYLRVGNFH